MLSVVALLYATHLLDVPIEDVMEGLFKRMQEGTWVVVCKTLIAFHRLFRDGHEVACNISSLIVIVLAILHLLIFFFFFFFLAVAAAVVFCCILTLSKLFIFVLFTG
jgi:hypothetical protein